LSAIYASTLKSDLMSRVAEPYAKVNGFHDALQVGALLALTGAVVALLVIKNNKVDGSEAMSAAA
jgi:hypothetical protein